MQLLEDQGKLGV